MDLPKKMPSKIMISTKGGILNIDYSIEEIIAVIKNKRKLISEQNKKSGDERACNEMKVLQTNKEAIKAEVYGMHLIAASKYWFNIVENGSEINEDFTRLLNVLSKLNQSNEELKVARIYLHFANQKEKVQIRKRLLKIKRELGEMN